MTCLEDQNLLKPTDSFIRQLRFAVLALVLFSCGEQKPEIGVDEKDLSLPASYTDHGFVQEYHEAFPVDRNEKGAQEVKAILKIVDGG
jgi:hypothetical protein